MEPLVLVLVALVPTVLAGLAQYLSKSESIPSFFISTTVEADGATRIDERIDYDFGRHVRRGIYRDIPDLRDTPGTSADDIAVSSETAPDQWLVEWENNGSVANRCSNGTTSRLYSFQGLQHVPRLCIGDPDRTISGRHVYSLTFSVSPLHLNQTELERRGDFFAVLRQQAEEAQANRSAGDRSIDISRYLPEPPLEDHPYDDPATATPPMQTGDRLVWEPVGAGWTVPINTAEVHLRTPFELVEPRCTDGKCAIEQLAPGHIKVVATNFEPMVNSADNFSSGETLELVMTLGDPVPMPAAPTAPGLAPDSSVPPHVALLTAFFGTLTLAGLATLMIKRLGANTVYTASTIRPGSEPTGGTDQTATTTVSDDKLHELAPVRFEPPSGIEPWQAGVLYRESVEQEHKTAWLLQQVVDGRVTLTDDKPPSIQSGVGQPSNDILRTMFALDKPITLGTYDGSFATAMRKLHQQQSEFLNDSPLWKVSPNAVKTRIVPLGLVATVLGLVAVAVGGWQMGTGFRAGLSLLLPGIVAFALGAMIVWLHSALAVRTAEGSAKWLEIESFRNFLANAKPHHADDAAESGSLGRYAAWAVALGQLSQWTMAVNGSSVPTSDPELAFAGFGSTLQTSYHATNVRPSTKSSGSGFSGGGFSGGGSSSGGGGGGGGGSW